MSKPSASAEAASYNASISSCERSSSLIRLSLLIEDRDHLDRQAVAHLPGFAEEFRSLSDLHEKGLVHTRVQLQHIAQDRKSTRLNSSHVKISYAVFCLKKK